MWNGIHVFKQVLYLIVNANNKNESNNNNETGQERI